MATDRVTQETSSQPPEGPVMCKNICGFFGSPATMGLCSQCYKSQTVVQQAKASAPAVPSLADKEKPLLDVAHAQPQSMQPHEPAQSSGSEQGKSLPATAEASSSSSSSSSRPEQPAAPTRCGCCKKRVGLTGFKCRCGNTYCALHRYSDKHSCSYDYKAAGQEAIAKANPRVVAAKVVKI